MQRCALSPLSACLVVLCLVRVAPCQMTGPIATGRLDRTELVNLLKVRDEGILIKSVEIGGKQLHRFTIHQTVGDVRHRVVVMYWPEENRVCMVVPLSRPLPETHELSAEVQARIKDRIAPTALVRLPLTSEPGSGVLAVCSVLEGAASRADFTARLDQLLRSVAETRPVWMGLRD
jgi:hypothetical protein